MNSTEEISSYRKIPPNNDDEKFYSKRGTLPQNYEYNIIKEPSSKSSSSLTNNKKEKKWSLGSLFRRKKKNEIIVETSSDDEEIINNNNNKKRNNGGVVGGFLGRSRRRKSDNNKRRKNKTLVGGFDHIVLPKDEEGGGRGSNYYYHREDSGILSDPNCGSLHHQFSNTNLMEIESKKIIKGKELIKARAAARRTTLGNESSSDNDEEDSFLSNNSSLLRVVKSDESLAPKNDVNLSSRRSRAARTERYLKRHSRDGENPHNYLRLSKSDADRSPSRSPLPKSSIFTIPPNHGKLLFSVSNSTSNPTYKPPLSMNEYNNLFRGDKNDDEEIIHVNFPVFGPNSNNNKLNISRQPSQPPQPPPRDPNRTVFNQFHETVTRPSTMYLDFNNLMMKTNKPENLMKFPSKGFNNNTLRSSSEQNIPNETWRNYVPLRPASTTPEPNKTCYSGENFNYLADKKPRSRKPIFIQPNNIRKNKCESPTQKSLDFWKQIEETVNKTLEESPPQIFTSETHVQSQVFLPNSSNHSKEEEKRKSSNLEEALVELEAIYNSLRLGDDENLLDRAEQKENESLMMAKKLEDEENRKKSKKLSKTSYKIIPNTVEDDMYNRKFVKEKSATISDPQGILSKMSYLMNAPPSSLNHCEEDTHVIFDDFSYRNLKKRSKTVDSQLPFGIPLNPTLNSTENDYLHVKPALIIMEKNHQNKPIPDIVKDDLAFRNLRKDSNKYPKLDLNYLKKRRAVRSLSANIGTLLMGNDDEEKTKDSKNLTNIADAMEIARKVLREKEQNLNDTHKAFMSDSDVKISNGRKLFCDEVIINKKTENHNYSSKSSLDDLLNSLAAEAQIQSQRIDQELKELDHDQNNKRIKNEAVDELNYENFEKVQNLKQKTPPIELKANIVQSCFKNDDEEHDYENINSDEAEKRINRKSSFQQCKNELIASFQELKNEIDDLKIPYQKINNDAPQHRSVYENVDVAEDSNNNNNNNNEGKQNHSLQHDLGKLFSCPDEEKIMSGTPSPSQESRENRIAKYKEERRKQLNEKFANSVCSSSSSSSATTTTTRETPKPTRTSKLRAQQAAQNNSAESPKNRSLFEKSILSPSAESPKSRFVIEKDKSGKRKSNLNRSLTSEVVPPSVHHHHDEATKKVRNRHRLLFQQEEVSPSNNLTNLNNVTTALSSLQNNLPSPTLSTASSSTTSPSPLRTPKRSDLSVHMENARRSVILTSESHKYKPFSSSNKLQKRKVSSTSSDTETNRNIASKMEELAAFTRETLARVERLANRNRPDQSTNSKKTAQSLQRPSSSILKQNRIDKEIISNESLAATASSSPHHAAISILNPVSILKRDKTSNNENNSHHHHHHLTQTPPPVTFSPNVVEPSTSTKHRQGILKKRRSLDESTVMRHRSCSPDVMANNNNNYNNKSILKNQRRSSLEELRCTQSSQQEVHQIQGILKRKSSKNDDDDNNISLNSPHGILKRRSGASSAGSTGSTPHVSITTAVILAAAGGAEMILDDSDFNHSQDVVKPILKKKSLSGDEHHSSSHGENTPSLEGPRPILKKKSSTDTDDGNDDRPPIIKTILKLPKTFMNQLVDTGQQDEANEVRPILKSFNSLRADSPRPRLSFCSDSTQEFLNSEDLHHHHHHHHGRRSYTICSDFNVQSNAITRNKGEDRDLKKTRPLSVSELVKSFENNNFDGKSGAIPKRFIQNNNNNKRNSDRYRTQPVTSDELLESRNLLRQDEHHHQQQQQQQQQQKEKEISSRFSFANSIIGSSRSLDTETFDFSLSPNNFHSTSLQTGVSPESPICHKTSSDSAFQSLGDGLEIDEPKQSEFDSEMSSLADQMKSLAEEAKKKRLDLGERRSILKLSTTESGSSPSPKRSQSFASPSRTLLKNNNNNNNEENSSSAASAFHKVEPSSSTSFTLTTPPPSSSIDKDDEGISCNDDDGDESEENSDNSEEFNRKNVKKDDTTSDGESSGGREVKSIFKSKNFRLQLEGCLSKSKSSSSFLRGSTETQSCRTKKIAKKNNSPSEEEGEEKEKGDLTRRKSSSGLRRSHTHTGGEMPQTLADIRAKLQENGEKGWMKRVPINNNAEDELRSLKEKNRYNDELIEKSLLEAKKDELDAASKRWKNRVEKSDAEKFSVAGKMSERGTTNKETSPLINLPAIDDNNKRTPQAKRYKGKDDSSSSSSTPSSPDKIGLFDLTRSKSALSPIIALNNNNQTLDNNKSSTPLATTKKRIIPILKPDNDTFTDFFKSVEHSVEFSRDNKIEINQEDFDAIPRQSLLIYKKNVQVRRRRGATKNPIKALADRSDIANEYTEIITGVAEREKKRLNIEKLALNSDKALEALAGLASKEDFKSVALKKSTSLNSSLHQLQPWQELMLLQIKGRRQIQTRLVEPNLVSINEGDCFIVVTGTAIYNYTGRYSNVIEQSRASDIANAIQKTNDLGCKATRIINLSNEDLTGKNLQQFWQLLGAEEENHSRKDKKEPEIVDAGHPNEDETFERNILNTNMIYLLEDNELVPYEEYWGKIPKIEMLNEHAVIVFDFGTEMYVWSGKTALPLKKNLALKLAKELWNDGFNYTDCNINPLNIAAALGEREAKELPLKGDKRPDWALFAKITQHRETILFREKFLDWPDFSRVIQMRSEDGDGLKRGKNSSIEIRPCNVEEMLKNENLHSVVDLVVQNIHLGRGDSYFDEETRRLFEYDTEEIKVWRILENTHEELTDIGKLYDADSYIYSWKFRQTVKGRELNGKPSKFAQVGRDMCIFFCWQGLKSSINEKCTAAFLTVELDKENAPQIRVVQGSEPAAFLRLFSGAMVINSGKYLDTKRQQLFIVRGELNDEAYLMEVNLTVASLRSKTSFVLYDKVAARLYLWHGCKVTEQKRNVAKHVFNLFHAKREISQLEKIELNEKTDDDDVFKQLLLDHDDGDNNLFNSLLNNNNEVGDFTPRLFKFSSTTGSFMTTEILCPHRSRHATPYAFVQHELYTSSQPSLFLFDNATELWLWHGWWPEHDEDVDLNVDQTGSGKIRWQAERKAAMQTAVNYWRKKNNSDTEIVAYLVWAGLEPLEFRNLFPTWETRLDARKLNLQDGRKDDEKLILTRELAKLSRTIYPLEQILQRPLPDGVDPTQLEIYLSNKDFEELLEMTKAEFEELPVWRKTTLKKEKGLF